MGFALDLFLKVAQIHAIFFFYSGVHGVCVGGTRLVIDRKAGTAHHGVLPGLAAYKFPCLFGILQLHEGFNTCISYHLLCAFLIRFQNARVILTGHNGGNPKPTALSEHYLKARRYDGCVFVYNAQVRPNTYGVRGQGFQCVGGIAFNLCAEAHGTGIAYGRQADLAEARKLLRGFFQRGQQYYEDFSLKNGVSEIHFAVFRTVDVAVGICQAGQCLAEVGLCVAELLRKGWGLILQLPPGNPAGGAQSRLDGGTGFLIQLRVQGQLHTFFQSQGITDHAGGELQKALVSQIH